MGLLRILVADDHRVFADALGARLDAEPDLAMIGVATSVEQAERMVRELAPDVALLDVEFADGDGIALVRRIAEEGAGTGVVVVTFHDDASTATAAVRAGAVGFVAKDAMLEDLLRAVRGAARGERWVEPRVLGGVLYELSLPPDVREHEKLRSLTDRERAVLDCKVRGLDRAATARELFLSVNTVRTHTQNVMAKLGVHSTLKAVAMALHAGADRERRPPS